MVQQSTAVINAMAALLICTVCSIVINTYPITKVASNKNSIAKRVGYNIKNTQKIRDLSSLCSILKLKSSLSQGPFVKKIEIYLNRKRNHEKCV